MKVSDLGLLSVAQSISPSPVVEKLEDRRGLPPYLEELPAVALEYDELPYIPLLNGVTKHETSAAVTGGFRNQILDKLKSIPNFLDQVLVKDLVKATNNAKNVAKNALNFLTTNYRNLRPQSLTDGLNQVIEATSDALFNFPAFAQTDAWVKRKLPAFFYTFEHVGRLTGAEKVLKGSPLVASADSLCCAQAASHGTDLPYLFDLRSLDGTPDPEFNESTILHPDDQAVRDNFLGLIANFAKNGVVQVGGKQPAFPGYVSIAPVVTFASSFRECQMALWSGKESNKVCPPLEIVTAAFTKGFGEISAGADKFLGKIPGVGKIETPKIKIPGLG